MRLVVLTGSGPEHIYVTNVLRSRHELAGIVIADAPGAASPTAQVRRAFRRYTLQEFASRALRAAALAAVRDGARRSGSLRRELGPASVSLEGGPSAIHVRGANSPDALAAVAALQPDVIAVYGTAIVRPPMLALARDLVLNMHTGVSPRYRGADCEFWPIHRKEPEYLGATVHECVAAVDGGRIFASVRATVLPGDDVHAVLGRCVQVGADAYADALDTYASGRLEGEAQDLSQGQEYRMAMRGIGAEWSVRRRLRTGLVAPRDPRTGLRGL